MHYNNAADCVVFTENKIKGKRKTLTWDTACLTVHCHKFLGSRTVFAWLYFDDHYLTEREVRSLRIRRGYAFDLIMNGRNLSFRNVKTK